MKRRRWIWTACVSLRWADASGSWLRRGSDEMRWYGSRRTEVVLVMRSVRLSHPAYV